MLTSADVLRCAYLLLVQSGSQAWLRSQGVLSPWCHCLECFFMVTILGSGCIKGESTE
ncbi:unnamed protein product [Ixodes persulcatus]